VTDAIATLRASRERLRNLTEALPADQLERPSFCDGWTIAQVLSHLGSQSEIMMGFLAAARAGEPEPSTDGFPAVWDRWNGLSPVEQRDQALIATDQAVGAIEDAADDTDLRISLFGGAFVLDVPGFAALRLVEHAVHAWDIAVALDPAATIEDGAVELILAHLATMVGYLGKADAERRVRVEVRDPDADLLLVVGPAPLLAPWSEQPVAGILRGTGDELVRLVYGRVTDTDRLAAEGVSIAELQAVFTGA
jgi:uncharacterized protein (TIGR03083 family)